MFFELVKQMAAREGRHRETQGPGSNAVGTANEQHPRKGNGGGE